MAPIHCAFPNAVFAVCMTNCVRVLHGDGLPFLSHTMTCHSYIPSPTDSGTRCDWLLFTFPVSAVFFPVAVSKMRMRYAVCLSFCVSDVICHPAWGGAAVATSAAE